MERKPEALSAAFSDARAKLLKIKQLGITPCMSIEAQKELVEKLAAIKALETGTEAKDHYNGQSWYVESLVQFAKLSVEEQLEHCYSRKFAEQANETEMLEALRELAA